MPTPMSVSETWPLRPGLFFVLVTTQDIVLRGDLDRQTRMTLRPFNRKATTTALTLRAVDFRTTTNERPLGGGVIACRKRCLMLLLYTLWTQQWPGTPNMFCHLFCLFCTNRNPLAGLYVRAWDCHRWIFRFVCIVLLSLLCWIGILKRRYN